MKYIKIIQATNFILLILKLKYCFIYIYIYIYISITIFLHSGISFCILQFNFHLKTNYNICKLIYYTQYNHFYRMIVNNMYMYILLYTTSID